jgi:transcriptional regulator with XRE-family HTH domain
VEKRSRNSIEVLIVNYVASRVRNLRISRGWTQEELANESEISLAQIKRIELGYINTSIVSLYKITYALEVSMDEFFAQDKP